jgi:hypothetical protein
MSLDMPLVHPGHKPPTRPPPPANYDPDGMGHPDMTPFGVDGVDARSGDVMWIVAPTVSIVLVVLLLCVVVLFRKRRGALAKEHDAGRGGSAVDKPLLGNERGGVGIIAAGGGGGGAGVGGGSAYGGSLGRAGSAFGGANYDYAGSGMGGLGAPSDPVELRRLNFQTPGMMSHPPIPVSELSNHIEMLKANDNTLFSQEYEVSNNDCNDLICYFSFDFIITILPTLLQF